MRTTMRWSWALLLFASIPCGPLFGKDEAEGVNSRRGDPSPNALDSRVNDYTQQDERVDLKEDSGVVRVLRTDQKILVNDYVIGTFPIRNVHPREIRDPFRQVTGKEGGVAEVIRDKEKKENFLYVVCPRFQLPAIEEALGVLDQDWLTMNRTGSQHLYYKAKYRGAAALDRWLTFWRDGEGFSRIDPRNNAIEANDDPHYIKEFVEAAAIVDIPLPQAVLDVKIYEVDLQDDLKLGLDYIAWKNGPGRNLFEAIFHGQYNRERFDNVSSIFNPIAPRTSGGEDVLRVVKSRGSYLAANALLTAAYVDFLASKGKAKVLASERIVTRTGLAAEILALDPIPGFVAEPLDPGPRGLVPRTVSKTSDIPLHQRTLRFKSNADVGLEFRALPVLGTESMEVALDVRVSDAAGLTPQGLPLVANRHLTSIVRLRDGETVAVGGLRRREKVLTAAKVPVLGSIPVLGWLFGGETSSDREANVIVILTARQMQGVKGSLEGPADPGTRSGALGGPVRGPSNPLGFDQWLLDRDEK